MTGLDWLWWALVVALMLVGWVGTVVPLLPGPALILAGAVLHRIVFGEERSLGWWGIGGMCALMALAMAVDIVAGAIGAKHFGATRWGAIGGLAGAVVGLFFGLPGMLLGPVAGVLVGELLGGKGLLPAGRSTFGSVVGGAVGMVAKLVCGGAMIAVFALGVWR